MQNYQQNIIRSLTFLREVISRRLDIFFNKEQHKEFIYPELNMPQEDTPLNNFLNQQQLNIEEYCILILALAPHLQPNFIENIIQQHMPQGGEFVEMGGVKGSNYRGMLPTGETAQFILAGNDFQKRIYIQQLLQSESVLIKENVLLLEHVKQGEPVMSGRIIIEEEWLQKILYGKASAPKFSPDFPATKITTQMELKDLVLSNYTQNQINDLFVWLKHNEELLKDEVLKRKIKPGYRVLFYGPPGTGKTLTASLLGKQFEKDVYRIDLSLVVSKYIGETEKNLEKIFAKAENKNWILFFDEADALFGKRTNVQNSHDRYANQEVSYLLQRIEDFPGLLILASNFKSNLDTAFVRRFHSVIHFPAPNAAERLTLWQKTIPAALKPEEALDLTALANKHELTGASILNVVHYAALKSLEQGDNKLRHHHIIEGIRKEFRKEEKTMS